MPLEVDAHRTVQVSTDFARHLAAYAFVAGQALAFDGPLMLSAERFILRRGVTRARRAWVRTYGRSLGRQYFDFAEPVIHGAYWDALDQLHPIFSEERGRKVALVRGWRDLNHLDRQPRPERLS